MSTGTPEPTFASLLRRARLAAGITQEELAERARLSVRGINDLERGARLAPRKETVQLLADALVLGAPERAAFEAAARRHLLQPPQHELPAGDHTPPDLTHDAATARPPANAPVYGGFLGALPTGPLVGREAEIARLLAALDAAAGGHGRLLLLAGEPGVGKTRLAQELMVHTQERAFRPLTGRCDEQYASLPFFPFVEALTGAWPIASPALRQICLTRFAELGRLLPQLLPVPPQSEVEDPRLRMLHTVAGFLQALAAEGPLTLLLDDLHWADSASLELLAHLARALRGDRVLLLGTYRDVEVSRQHPLESTLASLIRDRVVESITLRGLLPSGTAALIRARFGMEEVSGELRDLVHERTEGNPFFTEEVLSALVEQGAIFRAGDGWDRKAAVEIAVPQSIRSVVGQRVGRLAPAAQELLRLASVLGQEWDLDVLLSATDQDEDAVLDHLDAAVATRLLEERHAGQGERYGFAHALIGQTLYEEVPRHRLRRLHLRAGETLERVSGEQPDAWAELARHFLVAGDATRAIRYSLRAGDQSARLYAHAEAAQHYQAALELLEEAGDGRGATQVREKLGTVLRTAGRYDAALVVLDLTAEAYRVARDLAGLERVTVQIARAHGYRGTGEEGLERLQRVLELVEAGAPSRALAELYVELSRLFFFTGRYRESYAAAERAGDLARTAGDDRVQAFAMMMLGITITLVEGVEGRAAEALRLVDEAVRLAEAVGDLDTLSRSVYWAAGTRVSRGELAAASQGLQRAMLLAERLGDPTWIARIFAASGRVALLVGDWNQARLDLERAVAMGGQGWVSWTSLINRGQLHLVEGQWEEATSLLREACARTGQSDVQALRVAAGWLAELDLLRGDAEAARTRLLPLLDRPGLEEDDVTALLPLLAWAYLELGDLKQAEQTAEQALRRARSDELRLALVDAKRVQAMILVRRRQWDEARGALEEGLQLARAMPYLYAEGRQLQVYGQMYLQKGESAPARERLEAALAIFRRLGAGKDIERTEQLLATLG